MARSTKRSGAIDISSEDLLALARDPEHLDSMLASLALRKGEAEQAETVLRKTQAEVSESQRALDEATAIAGEALERDRSRHQKELDEQTSAASAADVRLEAVAHALDDAKAVQDARAHEIGMKEKTLAGLEAGLSIKEDRLMRQGEEVDAKTSALDEREAGIKAREVEVGNRETILKNRVRGLNAAL